jgi:hypothetical protein
VSKRTLDASGRDELPKRRKVDMPVDYLLVMRVSLTADQVADIEHNEEAFCDQIKSKIKAEVRWLSLEVVK